MDTTTEPDQRQRRGGPHGPWLRARVDARLLRRGHPPLDELEAGWEADETPWPDRVAQLHTLTDILVSKASLKNWYPEHRLPMPGAK